MRPTQETRQDLRERKEGKLYVIDGPAGKVAQEKRREYPATQRLGGEVSAGNA